MLEDLSLISGTQMAEEKNAINQTGCHVANTHYLEHTYATTESN